jgi:hypothetical protein
MKTIKPAIVGGHMSDDSPNIVDDSNQQFVSIYVPNTQDASSPHYHYLRIGVADNAIEGNLPADPNVPTGPTNTAVQATVADGIVLYTTDSYTLAAPSINAWSSEGLSAVTDGADTLYTATYTTGAGNGMRPATVTYQNVDQMANTAAATINFMNGDALTYWNGNNQGLGVGGQFTGNYGFTTNLFGGTIMNLTNNSAEIDGFGSFKVVDSDGLSATEEIVLSVSPVASYAGSVLLINAFTGVMAALTAVTGAMDAAMTGQLQKAGLDPDSLKTAMQNLYTEQIVATTLVTVIQAMSVVLAATLKIQEAAAGAALASIKMNASGITLNGGSSLIEITPTGINIVGGATTVAIGAEGFVVTASPQIALTAGETFANIAPDGIVMSAPTVNFLSG